MDDARDKARQWAEGPADKAEQATNKATDDEQHKTKGQAERSTGSLKKAGDKLREAFKRR